MEQKQVRRFDYGLDLGIVGILGCFWHFLFDRAVEFHSEPSPGKKQTFST